MNEKVREKEIFVECSLSSEQTTGFPFSFILCGFSLSPFRLLAILHNSARKNCKLKEPDRPPPLDDSYYYYFAECREIERGEREREKKEKGDFILSHTVQRRTLYSSTVQWLSLFYMEKS